MISWLEALPVISVHTIIPLLARQKRTNLGVPWKQAAERAESSYANNIGLAALNGSQAGDTSSYVACLLQLLNFALAAVTTAASARHPTSPAVAAAAVDAPLGQKFLGWRVVVEWDEEAMRGI